MAGDCSCGHSVVCGDATYCSSGHVLITREGQQRLLQRRGEREITEPDFSGHLPLIIRRCKMIKNSFLVSFTLLLVKS